MFSAKIENGIKKNNRYFETSQEHINDPATAIKTEPRHNFDRDYNISTTRNNSNISRLENESFLKQQNQLKLNKRSNLTMNRFISYTGEIVKTTANQ